jgi:hypothetical protein
LTMTMANNRQMLDALATYWLRDYSRNFGVETLGHQGRTFRSLAFDAA